MTRVLVACAASFIVCTTSEAAKQTAARYDAATIKRCVPEENPTGARGLAGGTNATISPGRFNVPCVTVEQLIYMAYAQQGARDDEHLINDGLGGASSEKTVRGGPDWVHSLKEKYAIEATAAGATERTVLMGTLLRTLLEERFKLKIHREQEQVDMIALTAAKSGPKLKTLAPGDCNEDLSAPLDLKTTKPPCNGIMTLPNGPNVVWMFGGFDTSDLAGRLSGTLGLHVIDQVGLKGKFSIRLEFHPDENTPGIRWPAERDADTSVPMADNILNALERQLGLKVARTKALRGFIVIDHIERPQPDVPFSGAVR